jgi:hypothetical protein
MPVRSLTTVSAERPSISGRATPASTGVTSPIHSEDSPGVSTEIVRRKGRPATKGTRQLVEHAAAGDDVWAADLNLAVKRRVGD